MLDEARVGAKFGDDGFHAPCGEAHYFDRAMLAAHRAVVSLYLYVGSRIGGGTPYDEAAFAKGIGARFIMEVARQARLDAYLWELRLSCVAVKVDERVTLGVCTMEAVLFSSCGDIDFIDASATWALYSYRFCHTRLGLPFHYCHRAGEVAPHDGMLTVLRRSRYTLAHEVEEFAC